MGPEEEGDHGSEEEKVDSSERRQGKDWGGRGTCANPPTAGERFAWGSKENAGRNSYSKGVVQAGEYFSNGNGLRPQEVVARGERHSKGTTVIEAPPEGDEPLKWGEVELCGRVERKVK